VRAEWAKAGMPLTVVLANGVEARHPLWRVCWRRRRPW
jgi:hypothetical protein